MSRSKQAPAWHSTWWHSTWAKRVLVVGLCAVFAGCTVSPQKSATTNPSVRPWSDRAILHLSFSAA